MSAPSGVPTRTRRRAAVLVALFVVPAAVALAAASDPVRTTRVAARVRLHLEGARSLEGKSDLLLQRGLADCGPVALHNLLRVLELPSPGPEALADRSGTSAGGTTLGGLVRAGRALGVPLRSRRIALDDLTDDRLPLIAWLQPGHFVTVLRRTKGGDFVVHDPAAGAYGMPASALQRRWGGVVAVLDPHASRLLGPELPNRSGNHSPTHRRHP